MPFDWLAKFGSTAVVFFSRLGVPESGHKFRLFAAGNKYLFNVLMGCVNGLLPHKVSYAQVIGLSADAQFCPSACPSVVVQSLVHRNHTPPQLVCGKTTELHIIRLFRRPVQSILRIFMFSASLLRYPWYHKRVAVCLKRVAENPPTTPCYHTPI